MAEKLIDSDVKVEGVLQIYFPNDYIESGRIRLGDNNRFVEISRLVFGNAPQGLQLYVANYTRSSFIFFTPEYFAGNSMNDGGRPTLGSLDLPWEIVYARKYIVRDNNSSGTSSQFLKADGSLDETEYAPVANAWKLQAANAEVAAVVVAIEGNKGVFETMKGAGIDFSQSRNIYVDLSKAENIIDDIFAGYKELPVGVRYHLFFGNTQTDVKMNYSVESNLTSPLALTTDYPTAKCEFMRVTEDWTFADWEAKINSVSHSMDTGTLDSKESSTLQAYLDKQGIPYEKTSGGVLTNIGSILAALANGK